ncbi:MAG: zinc ribbon domain-containing protein [Treponema sp.]|nr:zinc ribbon domain-containing protein [Treponema sp.]
MKKKEQSAKFFCENCGAEVPQDARMCRKCGRFFSSVRCPKCGETGDASFFRNGCPSCGYAVTGNTFTYKEKTEHPIFSISKRLKIRQAFSAYNKKNTISTEDGLPTWMYIFTFAALVTTLIFVFIRTQT